MTNCNTVTTPGILQPWTILRLQSLRTRLAYRRLRRLHPSNYQFTTLPNYRRVTTFNCRPHHDHAVRPHRMSTIPTISFFNQRHTHHARTTHNTATHKILHPLTRENYCFLTAEQDDDTTVNLFYTTATSEPATRFFATALTTWQTTSAGIRPTTATTFGS